MLALLLLASTLVWSGRSTAAPEGPLEASPDGVVLFHGATFHTGFDTGSSEGSGAGVGAGSGNGTGSNIVEAVLVSGGRVLSIGDFEDLSRSELGQRAGRVDLGGGHAFPGFQDAHIRLSSFGESLESVNLATCSEASGLVRLTRERAAEMPPGTWIVGRGWDHTRWPGGELPTADALSLAVPLHPVLLWSRCGDVVLVNRAAMDAAGLEPSAAASRAPGGRIVLDGSGAPTGVLLGTSIDLVRKAIPATTPADRKRRVLRAQRALLALGVTCVHDVAVDRPTLALYRELQRTGELGLRVVAYADGADLGTPSDFAGLRAETDDERFGVAGVTFAVDGSLSARVAALQSAYDDATGERGLARIDAPALADRVVTAATAGFQPMTLAAGDQAVRIALDAYERTLDRVDGFHGIRPRIEGMQVVLRGDLERLGELSVAASMQPAELSVAAHWLVARLGSGRAATAHAWRSIASAASLPLAFGSGAPNASPNPLVGLHAAITRTNVAGEPRGGFRPNERLDARAALAGYTVGPAVAARQSEQRGRIAVGFMFDATVVDIDLAGLTPADAGAALTATILATVVDGEVVYRAN